MDFALTDEDRARLAGYYSDDVQRLQALLDRSFDEWPEFAT